VPAVVGTDDYISTSYGSSVPVPQTILDLLAARIEKELSPPPPTPTQVNSVIQKLLYSNSDLTMGLKLDLNRPFGNGRDDNNNGIVDEPAETSMAQVTRPRKTPAAVMPIDPGNDGVLGSNDDYLARQYLARHLYVLAMLLKDEGYHFNFDGGTSNNAAETARVLAQWAINVVDFRDADAIMTPFEYDINPFNGWHVDGVIGSVDDSHPERGLVWGCERPELLITGTFAFHDRRTEDLNTDPSGKLTTDADDPDGDFDQRLRPRGALFIEIYNPWTGDERKPRDFYDTYYRGVELNRRNADNSPVWRLAVTADAPSTTTPPTEPTGINIERAVYFANPSAIAAEPDVGSQMHYSSVVDLALLKPGRYAVVGSAGVSHGGAYVTTIGRRVDADETNLGLNSTRQIRLSPNSDPDVNQVEVRNNSNPPASSGAPPPPATFTVDPPMDDFPATPQVQPAIAVPVDRVHNVADPLSLSITEPLGGYPLVDAATPPQPWDASGAAGEGEYTTPYDDPTHASLDPVSRVPAGNGTTANFRRIHLQRLANPLNGYHPITNPYRTIDVMPVDLTVFNGVTTANDPMNAQGTVRFRCWERGDNDSTAAKPFERKLWSQEQSTPAITAGSTTETAWPTIGSAVHNFSFVLESNATDPNNPGQRALHTLGFLNRKYEPAFTTAEAVGAYAEYLGGPIARNPATEGYPFPWLPWNNRPFVSPMELILVPRSSSASLLWDFDIASTDPAGKYDNPKGRFPHTLSLFSTWFYKDDGLGNLDQKKAVNLYRLLEYATVRSRFLGSETLLNPSVFSTSASGTELRHPPFNIVSDYREPGRINLNTIYDERVWNALWGPHDGVKPDHDKITFDQFVENRRGYSAALSGDIFASDSAKPTFFTNPYRATGSPLLVPPDASGGLGLARLEIDSTMLRTNQVSGALTTTADFSSEAPRYQNSFSDGARHTNRNAYFTYQALQRLSNLVTSRSNVYALWLTVGYFEYEYSTANGRWELGQEVGLDAGTVKRHRAFYIIDRTIPVAFEPGQNHNVDKCVLLRRFIE
jgi:hypothetical protein